MSLIMIHLSSCNKHWAYYLCIFSNEGDICLLWLRMCDCGGNLFLRTQRLRTGCPVSGCPRPLPAGSVVLGYLHIYRFRDAEYRTHFSCYSKISEFLKEFLSASMKRVSAAQGEEWGVWKREPRPGVSRCFSSLLSSCAYCLISYLIVKIPSSVIEVASGKRTIGNRKV